MYALCGSVAEEGGERVRKGIFCLHLSPTSVHNSRNFLRKLSYVYDSLPEGRLEPGREGEGSRGVQGRLRGLDNVNKQ